MTKTQLSSSNPTKQQEFIGYLTLLSVSVVWGWGFIAAKESLLSFTPMSTLFYRFLLATVLTFILFHKRILNSDKSLMKKGGLIGLFQIAGLSFQMVFINKCMKEKSDPYALCFWEILFEFIAIALMCIVAIGISVYDRKDRS